MITASLTVVPRSSIVSLAMGATNCAGRSRPRGSTPENEVAVLRTTPVESIVIDEGRVLTESAAPPPSAAIASVLEGGSIPESVVAISNPTDSLQRVATPARIVSPPSARKWWATCPSTSLE